MQCAQTLTARTAWYVEGNSKSTPPHHLTPLSQGKHSAQAGNAETAGGVRDQSRMAATRYEAWGNAREPDGGTPGCTDCCHMQQPCPRAPPDYLITPIKGIVLLPLIKSEQK